MKAYIVENGKPILQEMQKPEGKLVEVKAVGVNRADVFYLDGKYPYFGLEFAGIDEGGKRVAGLINGGAYAEFVEADENTLVDLPEDVSFEDAVCVLEGLYTAYYNLVELADVQKGEKVLIHGGGSGIGPTMIQLAKLLGAEVFATAGKAEKLELIKRFGAKAINYKEEDFAENKYDVIVDIVGADYFNRNIAALNKGGRLCIIGFISGAKCEAKLGALLTQRLTVFGSTTSGLPPEDKARLRGEVVPYIGKIKPVADKVFEFEELPEALEYVKGYRNVGKVVVSL